MGGAATTKFFPSGPVGNPDLRGISVGGRWLTWVMEATAATDVGDLDAPADVLAAVRASRAAEHREAARQLELAVDWAAMHSADSIHDAAVLWEPRLGYEEEAVPVAGQGAPLVAEFCVAEFAAALGMPTEVGRLFLGEALELRHRLPRVWRRVVSGDLVPWRARRIARETISHALSAEAAAHVDAHVGPVAHKVGPAQTQRLIDEAIARHMPETVEETRRRAADGRHFTVDHDQVTFAGTSYVHGELDLADALDLDQAVAGRAELLKDLGCAESLDVRRAIAVGEIARRQLALDLTTGDESQEPAAVGRKRPRQPVTLFVHLHQSALEGAGGIGRVENTRGLVTADQIRTWCGNPDAKVTVKPVHRPGRPRARGRLRGAGPDRRTRRPARPLLRVPVVHPARPPAPAGPAWLRLRPRDPPRQGWGDLYLPARAAVSATSPAQDPRRLDLHDPRTRQLPVVELRTATSTCATTPAPSTSPATPARPRHHPTSSHHAPTPPGRT